MKTLRTGDFDMTSISNVALEQQLMASDSGQAVYDALIQANVDLRTVSIELVKDMLNAECRYRQRLTPHSRNTLRIGAF